MGHALAGEELHLLIGHALSVLFHDMHHVSIVIARHGCLRVNAASGAKQQATVKCVSVYVYVCVLDVCVLV